MLTIKACQQHRLVVMQPKKVKSFPVATVDRRRRQRETRSEEGKDPRWAHASKKQCRQWRSGGVSGVILPTRRKNEVKTWRVDNTWN